MSAYSGKDRLNIMKMCANHKHKLDSTNFLSVLVIPKLGFLCQARFSGQYTARR